MLIEYRVKSLYINKAYLNSDGSLSGTEDERQNEIVIITDDYEAIKKANKKNLPVIVLLEDTSRNSMIVNPDNDSTQSVEEEAGCTAKRSFLLSKKDIKADYYLELKQITIKQLNKKQLFLASQDISIEQANIRMQKLLEKKLDIIHIIASDVYRSHYGMYRIIADTKRLIIREITVDDIDALYDIYDEPEVLKYNTPLSKSKAEEIEKIQKYIQYMYGFFEYGLWILQEKDTNKVIGIMGLENRDINHDIYNISEDTVVELGYIIGRDYRKLGYAAEAGKAIISYAYRRLGIETIYAFISRGNIPSQSLVKKLGFILLSDINPNYNVNPSSNIDNIPVIYIRKPIISEIEKLI